MKPIEQRRTSPRARTLLEGHIIYNNRLSRMECMVRDLSENGARLVFARSVKVPPEFELQIPRKKLARRAQVMWYDGQNHGIRFLDDGEEAAGGGTSVLDGLDPLSPREGASSVPAILEEARQRIAELLGISADVVQLKVEFDR